MSEVAFCKSLLTALDARPVKLSSDHIADARRYPAQGAYTLPRLPHPPHPKRPISKSSKDASSSNTLSIILKPMKPSSPTIPLPSIDPTKTSIYDLKTQYATQANLAVSKIKILYKKRPATDSKTIAEVVGQDVGGEVEFGVMVMGGAAVSSPAVGTPVTSPPAVAPSEAEKGLAGDGERGPAAQGPSGKEVVATEEFWSDLKNFVMQRTRDEVEAERLMGVFRGAWEGSK